MARVWRLDARKALVVLMMGIKLDEKTRRCCVVLCVVSEPDDSRNKAIEAAAMIGTI